MTINFQLVEKYGKISLLLVVIPLIIMKISIRLPLILHSNKSDNPNFSNLTLVTKIFYSFY